MNDSNNLCCPENWHFWIMDDPIQRILRCDVCGKRMYEKDVNKERSFWAAVTKGKQSESNS